ncbi:class I SAM-dependent rRNA methyltransferase [Stieleria varia]|uniref:class I SAM-dependent rRNA methyltransferase n=1 Tax=Stieleria varia TaxID=2528005 RepID=UPI0038B5D9EA
MPPAATPSTTLRLRPGRHFPFLARHPWVHAHAMAEDGRDLACGQVVDLIDHDGNWVARGIINPNSRLRVRLYVFTSDVSIDETLWRERIDAAIARRRLNSTMDRQAAERLIFSESDLISGLIVDRYADCLGVQFTAGALLPWREAILRHLHEVLEPRQIVVKVDERTAKFEGMEPEEGTVWSATAAGEIPQADVGNPTEFTGTVHYQQNGLQLAVDLLGGQKTGGYLDQRNNHAVAAGYCHGRRVLDVCCYTGGFGLVAAKAGAAGVVGVDSSQIALDAAASAAAENGIENIEFIRKDCFDALKQMGEQGDRFDVVVLDPPRFAGSRKQVDSAIRAYRRLNGLAVDLLPPGGILVTCSCSGRVSRADFMNMLLDVGRRRGRDIILLENRGPSSDHPVAASCPESDYLKCLICQVM